MLKLSSPVTEISGIGPAKAQALRRLGVTHIRDLLFSFPRKYEDFSRVTAVHDLQLGQQLTVRGFVKSVTSKAGWRGRRRMLRIFTEIEDPTGVLHVTWYNLPFLAKQLPVGREVYVAGTVEQYTGRGAIPGKTFAMRSPALEFADRSGERVHTASITPVYSETKGVTSRFLRYQVKNLLPIVGSVPEYLPAEIIRRQNLMDIHDALRAIHFPQSNTQLLSAQARLRFDELFFLQLAALVRREQSARANAYVIKLTGAQEKALFSNLPFKLTGAQQAAWREIAADVKQPHPMNRLLQGDVGSGKSVLALLAAQAALLGGYKVLYLAPTEILARQQAQYFSQYIKDGVRLLVGALNAGDKAAIKQSLAGAAPICVVGTHALLQQDVVADGVGLVIIDEQHRFGVRQRQALRRIQNGIEPHFLSMTATPIPRTLNLTVYGDLDVSVLNELPPGRQQIVTAIIGSREREQAIIHTLELLHQGRQGFVVAPLIENSEKMEVKSAKQAYEEMRRLFPGVAVGLLHGQMSSEEKEAVMRNFTAGAIQLLVSTAVVEVGVNVPNAAVLIIEGAERFGLAQLHQFRGRIGRGAHKSFCYLFTTSDNAADSPRLQVLAQTTDGFKIAEEDLRLRGPGEVYGVTQSGFGDLQVASLLDYETIKNARAEAQRLLKKDPQLVKHPILRRKVEQKNLTTHFE